MGIKFQTDQSGANNNVCSTSSQTFNFSLTSSNILDSASFSIKKGSSTTANIVVSIHDQPNGSGNIVESVSVLASNVTQTFSNIVFTFSSNTTLNSSASYSLVVSSTSSCSGSSPYSIKSGNFQVIDSSTNSILNTGYGISASVSCDSLVLSQSKAQYSNTLNILISNSFNSNVKLLNNIIANIENTTSIDAKAMKIISNNNNRKIKLDGNNVSIKIYLGNTRKKVYHSNRLIIDNQ